MTIEYFIENVADPAASIVGAALDYAMESEILAETYQDAVDFVTNLSRWVTGFFDGQSANRVFVQGTEGDDVLRSTGARWPWETENNFLYAYSGNDLLEGGVGDDLLVGGTGADRYIWNSGDGNDLIGDHDDAGHDMRHPVLEHPGRAGAF